MTVTELIEKLKEMPQGSAVVYRSHWEDGLDEVNYVTLLKQRSRTHWPLPEDDDFYNLVCLDTRE